MKEELTITEIASRLGVSERTALRRIAVGKLLARKLGPNRYLVSTEDIENLAPRAKLAQLSEQVQQMQDTLSGQGAQQSPEQITALASELSYQSDLIEALKQEVGLLRDRVAALETRGKRPTQRVIVETGYSVADHARRPTPATSTSTRPLLPDAWSSWTPFIERHGISSERRPLRAISRANYCEPGEYMQQSKHGLTLVKCALSPDGMNRLLVAIKELPLGEELQQCEVSDCPCHEIIK